MFQNKVKTDALDRLNSYLNGHLYKICALNTSRMLADVIKMTFPNRQFSGTMNNKAVKELAKRIKKDWLGTDLNSPATATYISKNFIQLDGFPRVPFVVEKTGLTKSGKKRRRQTPADRIEKNPARMIDLANKYGYFDESGRSTRRRLPRASFRTFAINAIFTTFSALKKAANMAAEKAGQFVNGWASAARAFGLATFPRAIISKNRYAKKGNAAFHENGQISFNAKATNDAAPNGKTATAQQKVIDEHLQRVWEKNLKQTSKKYLSELKRICKECGAKLDGDLQLYK